MRLGSGEPRGRGSVGPSFFPSIKCVGPSKQVLKRGNVPLPAARGPDAASIEGGSNTAKAADTRAPNGVDDREQVGREPICLGDLSRTTCRGSLAGVPRVA